LTAWYRQNCRSLPWRENKDPYSIWVSEIILQQTRVDQGTPYFLKFIKTFPNVRSLAKASEEKILRLWQGLGYYSRARNMHRCAKKIVAEWDGKFPTKYNELITLPGIGPYTAAAISSISVDEAVPVIDGNVYRVLSRVFGIEHPTHTPAGKKIFSTTAEELMKDVVKEKISPGEFNQAIMEFGALQCVPRNPNCDDCPLSKTCFANINQLQADLPIPKPKPIKQTRHLNYLIIRHSGKIWMKKRASGDVWQGLYDFMLFETESEISNTHLNRKFSEMTGLNVKTKSIHSIKHILTHQKLQIDFFLFEANERPEQIRSDHGKFVSLKEAARLPKPVFIDSVLNFLNKKN